VDQRKSTPKNRVFRAEKSQSREKTRFCRAGVKKWGGEKNHPLQKRGLSGQDLITDFFIHELNEFSRMGSGSLTKSWTAKSLGRLA
jgi:hypothetical protein